ncbi:MAG: hypothetical protein KDH96_07240 [Candidatus Riesia sp.]|nr:hypothetical protein [Candidatus Riesia sp.]
MTQNKLLTEGLKELLNEYEDYLREARRCLHQYLTIAARHRNKMVESLEAINQVKALLGEPETLPNIGGDIGELIDGSNLASYLEVNAVLLEGWDRAYLPDKEDECELRRVLSLLEAEK